ncbi:amidohydrolase family protein [Actinomadura rupiterrae]|uniref:amidohydrolase family protein n=1 Tax=Actinomadura rupiterrae TaxID=559627 RepID=UPI0020A2CB2D|nr:amidohydrolase family protein [Actinomadura rupiterrae]MCP2336666.1 cytosine/adenosine deaminase-related metal-dependent hydrolase [Actinomadura rupiterrae]
MTTPLLIKGGLVLAPRVLGIADVLVRDGLIAAVGPDLPVPDGAEVIDASGRIVLPGFVDTHRHMWQGAVRGVLPDTTLSAYLDRVIGRTAPAFRPEDIHAGVLGSALEALDSGVTTVVDWSHVLSTPEQADANVQALHDAGIRAVFGYCHTAGEATRAAESRRLKDACGDGLLRMAVAALGPDFGDLDRAREEWLAARDLGVMITTHMGGHGAEAATAGHAFLDANDLWTPGTMYVHANDYTDEQFKRIADHGGTVAVSPAIETAMDFSLPVTGRSRAAGVPTGLSADAVTSAPGDMFTLMRAAYFTERARPDGAGLGFTVADALHMATAEGARVAGLDGVTGKIEPGLQADLVLLRTDLPGIAPVHDPVAAAVLYADTRAVETVLVGGRTVKRDGELLADVRSALDHLTATAEHIAQATAAN